jgi:RNA polymerase II transcription mediator complex subunit 9
MTPSSPANNPPFPPPQTFDILPLIHDLLTRLSQPSISTAAITANTTVTPHTSVSSPLEPKDLPQAAVPIKLKIQRAKAAVSALPDVERTVEEQQEEIRELEGRIRNLRGVLGELGRRAGEKDVDAKGGRIGS